jgi:hypothetical protein
MRLPTLPTAAIRVLFPFPFVRYWENCLLVGLSFPSLSQPVSIHRRSIYSLWVFWLFAIEPTAVHLRNTNPVSSTPVAIVLSQQSVGIRIWNQVIQTRLFHICRTKPLNVIKPYDIPYILHCYIYKQLYGELWMNKNRHLLKEEDCRSLWNKSELVWMELYVYKICICYETEWEVQNSTGLE